VPIISHELYTYLKQNCIPGGTLRNWNAYGHNIHISSNLDVESCKAVLADPQTSGGLLVAVDSNHINEFKTHLSDNNLQQYTNPIGFITEKKEKLIHVQ
jgi:selenide,water dikinase